MCICIFVFVPIRECVFVFGAFLCFCVLVYIHLYSWTKTVLLTPSFLDLSKRPFSISKGAFRILSVWVYFFVYLCVCVYLHLLVCFYMYVCVCVYMCVSVCMDMYVCVSVSMFSLVTWPRTLEYYV